ADVPAVPPRRGGRRVLPVVAREREGDRRWYQRDAVHDRRQAVRAGAAEVPREVARRAARALRSGGRSLDARPDPRAGRLPGTTPRRLTFVRRRLVLVAAVALAVAACAGVGRRGPYHGTTERIAYGPAPSNVAELRVPAGSGPHPVVVLLHGGYYQVR